MQLRKYQLSGINLISESLKRGHRKIIRCAPTGSGKSMEIAHLCKASAMKGSRVIILTHRIELFHSTLQKIKDTNTPVITLVGGVKISGDYSVILAMEKTIWNRIKSDEIIPPDLIIADEIHFNNFTKIINHFPKSFLIGFSATPTGKHIGKMYTDIVSNISIAELIEQKYLCPCKAFQMQDIDEKKINSVKINKGEFDSDEMAAIFSASNIFGGFLREYKNKVFGQKGIIFCCNIKHCMEVYEELLANNIKAFYVHSGNAKYKMSEEKRAASISEFEISKGAVMVNAGILTTGYDHPAIRFIAVLRATTSLPLWLQMQGRGARVMEGKDYFTVLDFGGNHTRLGLWNQPREWTLLEKKKKKSDKLKAAPCKNCPKCDAMLFISAKICNYCGFIFPAQDEKKEGVMVEVAPNFMIGKKISEIPTNELHVLAKSKRFKSTFIWRVLRSRSVADKSLLFSYAKKMGYKNGWVFSQIKKIDDNKYSDLTI